MHAWISHCHCLFVCLLMWWAGDCSITATFVEWMLLYPTLDRGLVPSTVLRHISTGSQVLVDNARIYLKWVKRIEFQSSYSIMLFTKRKLQPLFSIEKFFSKNWKICCWFSITSSKQALQQKVFFCNKENKLPPFEKDLLTEIVNDSGAIKDSNFNESSISTIRILSATEREAISLSGL